MPGTLRTRSLVCDEGSTQAKSPQVRRHHTGIPCAVVLTVSFVISPVSMTFSHRHRRDAKHRRQLDASQGAPGPHDFVVRNGRRSSSDAIASIASHSTFRDDWP